MSFKKWVKSIQTAGYDCERMVIQGPLISYIFFLFSAAEVGYLRKNLKAVMAGKEPKGWFHLHSRYLKF